MSNKNEQISNINVGQQQTTQQVNQEVEQEFETLLQKPVGLRSKASVFSDEKLFESAQRMAKLLSSADLVPEIYRENIANSTIAIELAQRIGASPLAVMQNLYIVHGKPGWSAQFIIASLNTCGRYSPLRFAMSNDNNNASCFAWAYDLSNDKERIDGPTVSMQMAMDEGWYQKKGSKWKTMPEVMLRYRAASFFGKLYAPEIMMGMQSSEELIDMGEPPTQGNNSGQSGAPKKGLGGVKSKLKQHTKDNHIMDVNNSQQGQQEQTAQQEGQETVVIDNQNVDVSTGEIIDTKPTQANQADQADQTNQANQANGNKMINVSETAKAIDNPNDRLKANLENRQNKQTQRKSETNTNTNNKNTHMDQF